MSSHFQVTAIIPVYNGAAYLEETLISVLETREYSNTEIIVVNDGSTDDTSEIIAKFGEKIKVINQLNQGQATAINNALKISTSPYCSIVNCDDPIIDREIFKKSIIEFNCHKNAVVTYPNWKMLDNLGRVLKEVKVSEYSQEELIGNFNCIVGPGAVFKLHEALLVGGWNSRFKYVPDYDFWLRMSEHGEFIKINEFLASWRHHEKSISVSSKNFQMAEERINVIRNFLNESKTRYKFEKRALANSIYSAAILSAFDSTVNGRKLFIEAIRIYPLLLIKKKPKEVLFLITYPMSSYIIKKFNFKPRNYS